MIRPSVGACHDREAAGGKNQEGHRASRVAYSRRGLRKPQGGAWGNGGIDRHRDRYSHGGHSTVDYLSLMEFEQLAEFA
jgi:hypothetical protein